MNNQNFGLYIVETDRYEKTKEGCKKNRTDYRVLADSVIEAAKIVEAGFLPERDEIVVRSEYISHITGLPTNVYKTLRVGKDKE